MHYGKCTAGVRTPVIGAMLSMALATGLVPAQALAVGETSGGRNRSLPSS